MKRDLELVREILFAVESQGGAGRFIKVAAPLEEHFADLRRVPGPAAGDGLLHEGDEDGGDGDQQERTGQASEPDWYRSIPVRNRERAASFTAEGPGLRNRFVWV
jgi:hypothetical protein